MAVDNEYSQRVVSQGTAIVSTGAHFNTSEKALRTRQGELRTEVTVITHRVDFELRQREQLMKEIKKYELLIDSRIVPAPSAEAESSTMVYDTFA